MVFADAGQMLQLFLNLALNACEAMEYRGRLVLTAGPDDDGCCELRVADNGPGLSDEAKARLFTPFFTTKKHGTGLGLPMVARIAHAHDGTIEAAASPGGRRRIPVRIPLASSSRPRRRFRSRSRPGRRCWRGALDVDPTARRTLMADGRILVVDDEESMCQYLSILLEKEGYEVATAGSGAEALRLAEERPFDVAMTDIQMPRMDGIQLLKGIKKIDPHAAGHHATAYASEQSAIDAVNLGAFQYLHKHAKNDEIKLVVRNALEMRRVRSENSKLQRELRRKRGKLRIIGQSPRMLRGLQDGGQGRRQRGHHPDRRRERHRQGADRAGDPLPQRALEPAVRGDQLRRHPGDLLESKLFGHVKGSFTGAERDHDGFFRQAEGGTFFLDEVGEMPPAIQVKLLRVLQEREIIPVGGSKPIKVDLRLIAATNARPREGGRRQPLPHRPLLPAQRDPAQPAAAARPPRRHPAAGGPLPAHARAGLRRQPGAAIDDAALQALQVYDWPGNVRELENVIERASIIREGDHITLRDLPETVRRPVGAGAPDGSLLGRHVPLEEIEKVHILQVLDSVGGHKKRAAEILQINPSTLYRKLIRYGFAAPGSGGGRQRTGHDGGGCGRAGAGRAGRRAPGRRRVNRAPRGRGLQPARQALPARTADGSPLSAQPEVQQ